MAYYQHKIDQHRLEAYGILCEELANASSAAPEIARAVAETLVRLTDDGARLQLIDDWKDALDGARGA